MKEQRSETPKSDEIQRDELMNSRCRAWLHRNKIFFEVVAATVLAVMAVIISFEQLRLGKKQTALINTQTNLAIKQSEIAEDTLEETQRNIAISEAANWTNLWDDIRNFLWLYPDSYALAWEGLSYEGRQKLVSVMNTMLSPIGQNPLVIERQHIFERYLAALSELELAHRILEAHIKDNVHVIPNDENVEIPDIPYASIGRVITHIRSIQIDLDMFRVIAKEPGNEAYDAKSLKDSIFKSGFPWDKTLRIDNDGKRKQVEQDGSYKE